MRPIHTAILVVSSIIYFVVCIPVCDKFPDHQLFSVDEIKTLTDLAIGCLFISFPFLCDLVLDIPKQYQRQIKFFTHMPIGDLSWNDKLMVVSGLLLTALAYLCIPTNIAYRSMHIYVPFRLCQASLFTAATVTSLERYSEVSKPQRALRRRLVAMELTLSAGRILLVFMRFSESIVLLACSLGCTLLGFIMFVILLLVSALRHWSNPLRFSSEGREAYTAVHVAMFAFGFYLFLELILTMELVAYNSNTTELMFLQYLYSYIGAIVYALVAFVLSIRATKSAVSRERVRQTTPFLKFKLNFCCCRLNWIPIDPLLASYHMSCEPR